ncbi:MAG: HPr family phosphocarrier protein [Aestuariivirga sp.]
MSEWVSESVLITHAVGLHARPAVKFTKLAKNFSAAIEISATADGPWIDGKSIVKVMAMKARGNTTLHMRAKGADAADALASLSSLVTRDFDETEHAG